MFWDSLRPGKKTGNLNYFADYGAEVHAMTVIVTEQDGNRNVEWTVRVDGKAVWLKKLPVIARPEDREKLAIEQDELAQKLAGERRKKHATRK